MKPLAAPSQRWRRYGGRGPAALRTSATPTYGRWYRGRPRTVAILQPPHAAMEPAPGKSWVSGITLRDLQCAQYHYSRIEFALGKELPHAGGGSEGSLNVNASGPGPERRVR